MIRRGSGKLGDKVTYSADEGRDKGDTSLGTSNGLAETEEEGEVTAIQLSAMFHSNPKGQMQLTGYPQIRAAWQQGYPRKWRRS